VLAGEGPLQVGSDGFESLLHPILGAHALSREEYAAIWFGAGPAKVWLAAAGTLLQGPDATRMTREPGRAPASEGDAATPDAASLTKWVRRLAREARNEAARLRRSRAGTEQTEARLRELREELTEVRGEVEAGMMKWVRERQDAETRLHLYRDRERELRAQLKAIDEAGEEAVCGGCGRGLGDLSAAVREARSEEWEAVVQDGRWWRRRRDQLEYKPDDLKAMESRALALDAEVDDLSEELERRSVQALQLEAANARLEQLTETEAVLVGGTGGGAGTGGDGGEGAEAAGEARAGRARHRAATAKAVRDRIHGKFVSLTGGRLMGVFPTIFAAWAEDGRRGGEDFAILELSARITLAELAVSAGMSPGSVIFPAGLDRVNREDRPRVLADLVRLSRHIPLVVVNATARVAAAAPECFDFLYRIDDPARGSHIRRQESGLGTIWLQGG
ncbi:MAG: hypothetical protein OXE96_03625, partial [Gemmatimonadetes bacterium]|nr:hypothetical protein [Gemmatimonadota bacterium]